MRPLQRREVDIAVEAVTDPDPFQEELTTDLIRLITLLESSARASASADLTRQGVYGADPVRRPFESRQSWDARKREHQAVRAAAKERARAAAQQLDKSRTGLTDAVRRLAQRIETAEHDLAVAQRDLGRAEKALQVIRMTGGAPDQGDQGDES